MRKYRADLNVRVSKFNTVTICFCTTALLLLYSFLILPISNPLHQSEYGVANSFISVQGLLLFLRPESFYKFQNKKLHFYFKMNLSENVRKDLNRSNIYTADPKHGLQILSQQSFPSKRAQFVANLFINCFYCTQFGCKLSLYQREEYRVGEGKLRYIVNIQAGIYCVRRSIQTQINILDAALSEICSLENWIYVRTTGQILVAIKLIW